MPPGAAASCAVTMLIIQTLSCTTNVTPDPGDWELILEGWGIGKLVMFMFGVILLLCRTNRREMGGIELQFGSGKTIVLYRRHFTNIFHKKYTHTHISP